MKYLITVLIGFSSVAHAINDPQLDRQDRNSTELYTTCPVIIDMKEDLAIRELRTFYRLVNSADKHNKIVDLPFERLVNEYGSEMEKKIAAIYNLRSKLKESGQTATEAYHQVEVQIQAVEHARRLRFSLAQERAYIEEFLKDKFLEPKTCDKLRNYLKVAVGFNSTK